jgi:hypothetical protein
MVRNSYLISELGFGVCKGHIRTLQNVEKELKSMGTACTSPRWELKKIRIFHGADRYTPFQLQQGGLTEATK